MKVLPEQAFIGRPISEFIPKHLRESVRDFPGGRVEIEDGDTRLTSYRIEDDAPQNQRGQQLLVTSSDQKLLIHDSTGNGRIDQAIRSRVTKRVQNKSLRVTTTFVDLDGDGIPDRMTERRTVVNNDTQSPEAIQFRMYDDAEACQKFDRSHLTFDSTHEITHEGTQRRSISSARFYELLIK
jgi:hypothetical protein